MWTYTFQIVVYLPVANVAPRNLLDIYLPMAYIPCRVRVLIDTEMLLKQVVVVVG